MKFGLKVVLVLIVVLCMSMLVMAQTADSAKGKTLFASKCALCHGANGEGKAPMKTKTLVKTALTDADLSNAINKGFTDPATKATMKPVQLSAAEVADVVAFIKTLK
jgi:mono/diheme cytochrome c family protein